MIFNKKNKMNLKTPKKKKVKVKYFIYMFIIYIVFAYTFYYTMKNNPKITNEEFINFLLNGGSIKTFEEMSIPKVVNSTVNLTVYAIGADGVQAGQAKVDAEKVEVELRTE